MTTKKAISILKNVLWVGRVTVFVAGLAVTLALVLGVATAAFGANGGNLILGQTNVATLITRLAGTQGVNGAMFEVQNNNSGTDDTALSLKVQAGEPPMTVNSSTRVTALNADKLDNLDSNDFQSANAQAGGALSGNYPNPQIAAGAVGATELAPLPAVRAKPGNNQYIPNITATPIVFSNEDYDQAGAGQSGEMHSTTTNTSRLMVPRDGIYQLDIQVGWLANAGIREAFLTKNANGDCSSANVTNVYDRVSASIDAPYNHLGTQLALNQGDYVEVCVFQNSGTNRSISSPFTFAGMHYVSPR